MAAWDNDPRLGPPIQSGVAPAKKPAWEGDPRLGPMLLHPPVGQPSGMFAREFEKIGRGALQGLLSPLMLAGESGMAEARAFGPTHSGELAGDVQSLDGNPWAAAATDPSNFLGAGGLGGILRNLFVSETATGGSELAGRMVQGSGQPLAKGAGAVVGGLTGHATASAFSPAARSVNLAQGALGRDSSGELLANGISDQDALKAAAAAKEAQELGVTTVPGQHLPNGSLWHETKRLAKSPYGSETQARLEAQPGQIKELSVDVGQRGNLPGADRIPGEVGELTTVSNNAMGAFEKLFQAYDKMRQKAFVDQLNPDDVLSHDAIKQLDGEIDRMLKVYGKDSSAVAILKDVQKAIRKLDQPELDAAAQGRKQWIADATGPGGPVYGGGNISGQTPTKTVAKTVDVRIPGHSVRQVDGGSGVGAALGMRKDAVSGQPASTYTPPEYVPQGQADARKLPSGISHPGSSYRSTTFEEVPKQFSQPAGQYQTVRDGNIFDPSMNGGIGGTRLPEVHYETTPGTFNWDVQKALEGRGSNYTQLNLGLGAKTDKAVMAQLRAAIGRVYDASGSSLPAAKAAYGDFMKNTYEPAMKFLNRFTRGGNFDPTLPANAGAYAKLFKDGIPEYLGDVEMSNFKAFGRLLNEQGPEGQEAFRDLFRTILGQDLAKATERAGTDIGEEAYKTGSKTREAVGVPGTGRQRTIDEGLRMVYEGAGYSPQDAAAAVAGMNKVRRVLTAAGNFPPQINSSPQGEIAEGLRQSGWFNRMAEAAATTIPWAVSKAEKLTGIEKANRLLDQLISDPARMQDLIDLAKTNRWPKRLTDLMLTVDTMARNPRNPQTDSKESPNAVLR